MDYSKTLQHSSNPGSAKETITAITVGSVTKATTVMAKSITIAIVTSSSTITAARNRETKSS